MRKKKLARHAIDFEKSFDSLEWNCSFKVFEVMNFAPMFRKRIHTSYTNITSCVMSNGSRQTFSSSIEAFDRVAPIGASLEVLAQAIRQNENIHGLKIDETELKINMYGDDFTGFIKD